MKHATAIALFAATLVADTGCSEPAVTRNPYLRDPEATGPDLGGTDDIYDACQQAISSLLASGRLGTQPSRRVVLDRIVNQTHLTNYDERIVYNKFVDDMTNAAGDRLVFLNREAVAKERELQQAGQVTGTGVTGAPVGAELVFEIEIRSLAGVKSDTLQYAFRLTDLNGQIVWTKSVEVKKKSA
jgi:hypothetical protein